MRTAGAEPFGNMLKRKPKQILLVDDHPIVCEGLRVICESVDDLQLSGTCSTPEAARAFLRTQTPDLIIMDISMPGTNGLAATREIVATHPRIPILIFTCNDEKIFSPMAFAAGAKGLVMKGRPATEILAAIRTVLQGQMYPPARSAPEAAPAARLRAAQKLSTREQEILAYLVEGYTTARIALSLNLSLKTVESQRLTIRKKLGVESQADLLRWAVYSRTMGLDDRSALRVRE